jgi:hypothetical protein
MSTGLNAMVFKVLDMVDALAKNHPPTTRKVGARVWGPVYLSDENITIRFEMNRETSTQKLPVYEYCLHAARGKKDLDKANSLNCGVESDDSGLVRVLFGAFSPGGADDTAREGVGNLTLDLNLSRSAGVVQPDDKGVISVEYDNSVDQTTIQIHIRDVSDDGNDRFLPSGADYLYHRRADTSGDFKFEIVADFVDAIFYNPENLNIGARWRADGAGRADATVSKGDLVDDSVSVTQCWDGALETVFYFDSVGSHPNQGEAVSCVFQQPL